MSRYPKTPYEIGKGSMVLSCNRMGPHPVGVKPDLPGTVIVIHGVNDVGTSFENVEKGLCQGLSERLGWGSERMPFKPASYRMPQAADKDKLEDDPDAVFFKRKVETSTYSMVIPFYWGSREESDRARPGARTPHGQNTDRHGNRLDKDFSKGGGPFANATTTLVDMWNTGAPKLLGLGDQLAADPLRPVLKAPGRMYMILAAQRLAALIAMIRDYDPKEAVSVVAHSQGCLITLLAQAFLMDKPGSRPADTLILTHPPYSLQETTVEALTKWAASMTLWDQFGGGEDARMAPHYGLIQARQNLRARLDTLINIVNGVHAHNAPWSECELAHMRANGVHTAKWEPTQDRCNRGKVYLYFSPEDMTVGLLNVQGIGWQGVPDDATGHALKPVADKPGQLSSDTCHRQPRKELGAGFLQRVFTAKKRPLGTQGTHGKTGPSQAFKVGLPPQDFALREPGEHDHAHVTPEAASHSASLPEDNSDHKIRSALLGEAYKRFGLRFISGEALRKPVAADMHAGAVTTGDKLQGAHEEVDPIDATIGSTSDHGRKLVPQYEIDDPRPAAGRKHHGPYDAMPNDQVRQVEAALNRDKPPGEQVQIKFASHKGDSRLLITRYETGNEARLRHQRGISDRSFHGAIFGSAANHANVTAYDVAVGRGTAVSHPDFYRYLCAVADWRLKNPRGPEKARPGILRWPQFTQLHAKYWAVEDAWRKQVIEGNCDYYSTGILPAWLPLVTEMPSAIVSETTDGKRIEPRKAGKT